MRAISKAAAIALMKGREFHRDNTMVRDGVLYLFGNAIAKYSPGDKRLLFTLAGWNGPTTRERLNALLHMAGMSLQVVQCKGLPYLRDWREDEILTLLSIDEWHGVTVPKAA